MTIELILGILGVVLTVVIFAWQHYYARRSQRSRLKVTISESFPWNYRDGKDPYPTTAELRVANISPWPVTVESAGFLLPYGPKLDEGDYCYRLLGDGGTYDPVGATYPPQVIQPREHWTTLIDYRVLRDWIGGEQIVVTAYATDSEINVFKSAPTTLWDTEWAASVREFGELHRRSGEVEPTSEKAWRGSD